MMCDFHSDATAMNFSWVEDAAIAGCRGPKTDADLRFLASVGIAALVRLAHEDETGISASDVQSYGIEDFYEPVKDFTPPSQEQIDRVIKFLNCTVMNGKAVAVSCGAGYGRTGTILACYLVSKGLPPEEAIQKLITVRPCSCEILKVPGQRDAVYKFYHRLHEAKDRDPL
ncbi:MAG: dual specificity protein phosphatase family protein [Candidatus Methanomethylicaceae archaeon]